MCHRWFPSACVPSPPISKYSVRPVIFAIAMFAVLYSGKAIAQQTVVIAQTPQAVQNGSAHFIAHYNPDQMLRLVFALRPPHMVEEEQFLRDLQDVDSPLFHKYLTEEEWDERFAPSREDEQAVAAWAQSQGLTITQRYPNRLLVDVEAPVAAIEKALGVTIYSYQMGEGTYFSNDRDPSIPAALGGVIHTVLGLNNLEVLHKYGKKTETLKYPDYAPGPAVATGSHLVGDGDPKKFGASKKTAGQPGQSPSG
jgi:subtilase family serine protease